VLHGKAKAAGINLGCSSTKIDDNINTIKNVELDRIYNFQKDHRDANYGMHESEHVDYISDQDVNENAWIEVSDKRRSRKKLRFKKW
jgi:hypothetical protein